MNIQLVVNNRLTDGKSLKQLTQEVQEGLTLRGYLQADLSLGEVKEILDLQSIEDAMNWLHSRNECQDKSLIKLFKNPAFEVRKVQNILFSSLGLGEREAVSLAVETNVNEILIDDAKGINKSIQYNLTPLSSLDILVIAKHKKIIPREFPS